MKTRLTILLTAAAAAVLLPATALAAERTTTTRKPAQDAGERVRSADEANTRSRGGFRLFDFTRGNRRQADHPRPTHDAGLAPIAERRERGYVKGDATDGSF